MKYFFIIAIFAISAFGVVLDFQKSMRDAIKFEWRIPERPFYVGEMLHLDAIATNISTDTAFVYALDDAEVKNLETSEFKVLSPGDKYVYDTLAPGQSRAYHYILKDGTFDLYDPFANARSYENPVGIPYLPAGKYLLGYMPFWGINDSMLFDIIDCPAKEKPFLDTLANEFTSYQVGRIDDVFKTAYWMAKYGGNSPFAGRALVLARGAAWEKEKCTDAIKLDSLFWVNFGAKEKRYSFVSNPGTIRASEGIIGKCRDYAGRIKYLDWLEKNYGDDPGILKELKNSRAMFEKEHKREGEKR